MLVIGYSSAQADEIAAKVVWVKGDVKVITPIQTTGTALARGSELHEGDTIVTASDGTGLITFTDQTIVTLTKATALKISAYNYNKSDKTKEKYTITLVKGGLRTVTGLIAKDNRDAYQVKTPTATIGVRGTDFDVMFEGAEPSGNPKTIVSVNTGTVNVANYAGSVDVTVGTAAVAADAHTVPTVVPTGDLPDVLQKMIDEIPSVAITPKNKVTASKITTGDICIH